MALVLSHTLYGAMIFLWTFSGSLADLFFADFDLYEESTSAINKACPAISSALSYIPWSQPDIDNIQFQLRTPCFNISIKVNEADAIRDEPAFDVDKQTVVLATGWRSHLDEDYTEHMALAYNCRGGYNFLVVDTGGYVVTEFIKSASNVEKLGEFIAIGLQKLGIRPERLHLIGHSLGAHIMSSAGRNFYSLTGQKIKRITGLDPARPCFKTPPVFTPLTSGDADFVDIIHSNPAELGLEESLGHVDFYPNGLMDHQPACSHLNVKCSHVMSLTYYIESVYPSNEYNFISTQCADYANLKEQSCDGPGTPMGFAATKGEQGIYFLVVNDKAPYGMNINDEEDVVSDDCGWCQEY